MWDLPRAHNFGGSHPSILHVDVELSISPCRFHSGLWGGARAGPGSLVTLSRWPTLDVGLMQTGEVVAGVGVPLRVCSAAPPMHGHQPRAAPGGGGGGGCGAEGKEAEPLSLDRILPWQRPWERNMGRPL